MSDVETYFVKKKKLSKNLFLCNTLVGNEKSSKNDSFEMHMLQGVLNDDKTRKVQQKKARLVTNFCSSKLFGIVLICYPEIGSYQASTF